MGSGNFSELYMLLILIVLGFCVDRFKLISRADMDVIPRILFQVVYPALIVVSVSKVNPAGLMVGSAVVIAAALGITLLVYFIGSFALRRYQRPGRKEVILFQLMIGNVTFVGLPIIKTLFGETGIYYALVFSFAQDILLWSLCYWFFSNSTECLSVKGSLKKLVNPCMISLLLGLGLMGTGATLPGVFVRTLEMISQASIPLALLFMGSIFSRGDRKQWIPDKDVSLLVVVRILLFPLAVFLLLRLLAVDNALVLLLSFLFGLPFPLLSVVFAKQFEKDYAFALQGVLFSTALSLLMFIIIFRFYLPLFLNSPLV